MSKKIRVGVVGASGYTGAELLRILLTHPSVDLVLASSRQYAGSAIANIFPNLRTICTQSFTTPQEADLTKCDVVFFTTPHGVCMREASLLLDSGVRVIDFSGDFRLKQSAVFTHWYGIEHTAPKLLSEAVYGLPELYRNEIKNARLIANPGCYPTAVQLGCKPLLSSNLFLGNQIIADVKSGISGAGRSAKVAHLFAENEENFHAYSASGHRHQPEIEQQLADIAGKEIHCTFVPHLLPMIRGIEATLYIPLNDTAISIEDIQYCYENMYHEEHFVTILPPNICPETKHVCGTNHVLIGINRSVDKKTAIISVVEDNLIKGAAGQAVQCMNIMYQLDETTGLNQVALFP